MRIATLDDDAGRSIADLFAREVPEIAAGVVSIERVARIPGVRAKLAVGSRDPGTDAVNSCVGREAEHVRRVQEVLAGERIDILPWSATDERMIRLALAPMRVAHIELHAAHHRATVVLVSARETPMPGDVGVTVALASRLTGWEIAVAPNPDAA